jgi:steroid 5-alpha reductase family enzyme
VTIEWLVPLGAVLALGMLLWLVSVVLRDASIVDIFWGPMFVVMAAVGFQSGSGLPERKALTLALVGVWGLRLAIHLARRNLGRGEDYRYREMRERRGARFWIWSLPYVFLLQGVLAWVVALPVQAALRQGGDQALSLLDGLGALFVVLGFAMESVADFQLAQFRSKAENRDRVLDRGLFRYTRHPNYFGDSLVWWGLGLLGVAAGAPWSLVGPALMTFLLMRVSGVTLLERTIEDRRPGYSAYKRATNAFFPGPPRRANVQHVR